MWSKLSFTFALLISLNAGYEYVQKYLSYADARAYCQAEGTDLATITTDIERAAAIAVIEGIAPWIGIESVVDADEFFFTYPTQPEGTCPLEESGACVSWWADGQPLCPDDNGYECTVFYPNEAGFLLGAVNNDRDCETLRPFLCDEFVIGTCAKEDWQCRRNGQDLVQCGVGAGFCFCDRDSYGVTHCVANRGCSSVAECVTNEDCPSGTICEVDSCCSFAVCATVCDEFIAGDERRRFLGFDDDECSNFHACDGESAHGMLYPQDFGLGINTNNDDEIDSLNKYNLLELLSVTAIISILCTSLVISSIYCFCSKMANRNNSNGNNNIKGGKIEYDVVINNNEEDA